MDFNIINTMIIPIITVACLCIGYVMKKWLPQDDKYIPTSLFLLGAIFGAIYFGPTFEGIVKGMVSGLAAVGLHEAFTQFIKHPTDGFEKALKQFGIETKESEDMPEGIGGSFTPLLSAPSTTDKNWIHTSRGGYNSCILIKGNSCLPNCVGFAWGRWRQLLGKAPALSRANAEDWWSYGDGYKRGQEPKLGAVACWRKGKAGYGGDGAGHVAIVEHIAADGTVTFSNSAYGGSRFYTHKMKKGNYSLGGAYVFQGFIYFPESFDEKPAAKPATPSKPATKTVTYRVVEKSGMNVRAKASGSSKKVGTVSYGSKIKSSKKSGNWAYIDSKKGWVCIKEGKTTYLKKI